MRPQEDIPADDRNIMPEVVYLYPKEYSDWMEVKTRMHNKHLNFENNIYYKEGEVYWISLGKNVGFEEDGKGFLFTRPVLVVKGISRTLFFGVPLTSQPRHGDFYCSLRLHDMPSYGMISQMRSFDTARVVGNRYGKVSQGTLEKIRTQIRNLF